MERYVNFQSQDYKYQSVGIIKKSLFLSELKTKGRRILHMIPYTASILETNEEK